MLDGWIDIDEQEPVINDYVDMWIWDPRWEGAVLASVYVTDGIFRVIDDRTEEIRTFKAKYWRLATAPPLPEVPEVPLPCPFCGSKNSELYEGEAPVFEQTVHFDRVRPMASFAIECSCPFCGARGAQKRSEIEAVRAWNKRPTS